MEDFFAGAFKPTLALEITIIASICGLVLSLICLMALIWFEQFGSDRKRTLLNMLVSGVAWSLIEYLVFIVGSDIIRYLYGPIPHTICLIKATLTVALFLQILLFITAIVAAKYIFIFYLKNPTAVDDKFWILFLNLWIRKFAYLSQFLATFLPGNHPLMFYLCSGEAPKSLGSSSMGVKTVQITIALATVLNIVLIVCIQWKKITTYGSTSHTRVQSLREFGSDSHNMSDLVTLFITTCVFFVTVVFLSYLNGVKPETLNTFPNSALLHAFRLVWPMTLTFIFFLTHFVKHKNFRRLCKELITEVFCIICKRE